MKQGLLLLNLGTPSGANLRAVRAYLKVFLTDKRVVDLPFLARYALVYGFILPLRTKSSTHAYQSIWTESGSPLLVYSQDLVNSLKLTLNQEYRVTLGMRYGEPSILNAIQDLKDCEKITILPLYPQYSSAATGSALEETMRLLMKFEVIPELHIIRDFYQHPDYIKALADSIKPFIKEDVHMVLSYHGIPERQIIKGGCKSVCSNLCPPIDARNKSCYKAQCYQTSQLLAQELHLDAKQYTTAFQSRLGKTPWIKPYTDETLIELAAKGIKNLAIACPSFATDCLETLEEIGIRAKNQWLDLGGKTFERVPCLNNHADWVKAIVNIIGAK